MHTTIIKLAPVPGQTYAVSFDYDQWQYIVNGKEIMPLPKGIKAITVEVEQE